MSERYQRLNDLPENLHLEGAPLLIAAGALLKDNSDGRVLVQLKLQNLNQLQLVACKVSIRAFDPSGAELEGIENYSYLDLKVSRGGTFGTQEPIYLPDSTTRRFSAVIVQAVFQDGTVWQSPGGEWRPATQARQRAETFFSDQEIKKQFKLAMGGACPYIPATIGNLFLCACGAVNLSKDTACSKCGRELAGQLQKADLAELTRKKDARLAREQAERLEQERKAEEERLERERKAEEEKRLREQREEEQRATEKAKKRNKKIAAVICATVVIVTAVMFAITQAKYKEARRQYEELPGETIAAGGSHTVGLKADGTVVAVGYNGFGQCNVSQWKDTVAIAAGFYHTVGLKADGTVVAVGYNGFGQCNVSQWKDIVAVAGGGSHTVGLKADGTVVAVGYNSDGQCNVSQWKDIVAIAAGGKHTVGLKSDGTVVAVGYNGDGQCNLSQWKDTVTIAAGFHHTVGLKADGTVVAVGYNGSGQCNLSEWTGIKVKK